MPHATHSSRLAAHADLTATSEAHFVVLPDGHVLFARGEGLTRVGLEMENKNYFDLFEESRPDFCELIRTALRGETPLPFRCEYGGLTWVCEVTPKPCEGGFAAACTARAIEPRAPSQERTPQPEPEEWEWVLDDDCDWFPAGTRFVKGGDGVVSFHGAATPREVRRVEASGLLRVTRRPRRAGLSVVR